MIQFKQIKQRNKMSATINYSEKLEVFDKYGFWKSEISCRWYEKTYHKPLNSYRPGEMKTYSLVEVDEDYALEIIEEGLEYEDYAPDSNWTDPSWRSNFN